MPKIDYQEALAEGYSEQDIFDHIAANPGTELVGAPAGMLPGPPTEEGLGQEDPIGGALALASGVGAARMAAPVAGRVFGGLLARGAAPVARRVAGRATAELGNPLMKMLGKFAMRKAAGPAGDVVELLTELAKARPVAQAAGRRAGRAVEAEAGIPVRAHIRARPKLAPGKTGFELAREENAKAAARIASQPKPVESIPGGPRATHAEAGRPVLVAPKPRGMRSATNVGVRPTTPRRVSGGPAMEAPGKLMSDLERSLRAETEIRKLGVTDPETRIQLLELLRQAAP